MVAAEVDPRIAFCELLRSRESQPTGHRGKDQACPEEDLSIRPGSCRPGSPGRRRPPRQDRRTGRISPAGYGPVRLKFRGHTEPPQRMPEANKATVASGFVRFIGDCNSSLSDLQTMTRVFAERPCAHTSAGR